ncbi:MAG: proline racemase family protein, partial [Acidobacteriota bacterium]
MDRLQVIDSHTEGEPTRVVVDAGEALSAVTSRSGGTVAERLAVFRRRFDSIRSAVVLEPRGFDAMVGALLVEPVAADAAAGMIFFNNADTLNMCGHGTIGVVATLAHLGRIGPGRHRLESSVGDVEAVLHEDGSVSIENVFSYRYAKHVAVETRHHGVVHGDVAGGGNWFFLVDVERLDPRFAVQLDPS